MSLRYFNVYGERKTLSIYATVVGIFINQLPKSNLDINGDGNQRRDFTYVGDVVSANILASSSKKLKEKVLILVLVKIFLSMN